MANNVFSKVSIYAKFKCDPPDKGMVDSNCSQFESIYHVSHVGAALQIVSEKELKPRLVNGESILNTQRVFVTWLSPNSWGEGYRYGNIRFEFPFRQLIQGKKFYWVENVDYDVPACRILVTKEDRANQLMPYEPKRGDGPWILDSTTGNHYYNRKICLEFMFEESIPLISGNGFSFVKHHNKYCSVNPYKPDNCREIKKGGAEGGGRFLTRAIALGTSLEPISKHCIGATKNAEGFIVGAFNDFTVRTINKASFSGQIKSGSNLSMPLMRAIMAAYSYERIEESKLLASLFNSREECLRAAANLVAESIAPAIVSSLLSEHGIE